MHNKMTFFLTFDPESVAMLDSFHQELPPDTFARYETFLRAYVALHQAAVQACMHLEKSGTLAIEAAAVHEQSHIIGAEILALLCGEKMVTELLPLLRRYMRAQGVQGPFTSEQLGQAWLHVFAQARTNQTTDTPSAN